MKIFMNISLASCNPLKQVLSRRLFSFSISVFVPMDRAGTSRPARKLMPNQSIRSTQKNAPKLSSSNPAIDFSPLFIDWPPIDSGVANKIFEALLELLEPLPESLNKLDTFSSVSTQKKRRLEPTRFSSETTASQEAESLSAGGSNAVQTQLGSGSEPIPCGHPAPANPQSEISSRRRIPPRRLKVIRAHTKKHFALGLNSVTRHLEEITALISQFPRPVCEPTSCKNPLESVKLDSTADGVLAAVPNTMKKAKRSRHNQAPSLPPNSLRVVFTCRSDFDDTSLIDLLPALIEQANKMILPLFGKEPSIRLVELPAGSQEKLTKKLGIKRTTTMGALGSAPGIDKILKLFDTADSSRPSVK